MRDRFHRPPRRKQPLSLRRTVAVCACAALLTASGFALARYAAGALRAERVHRDLAEVYQTSEVVREETGLSAVLRQFEVFYHAAGAEPGDPAPTAAPEVRGWPGNTAMVISPSLRRLRQRNSDIIGWLSIPGALQQAVVQRDNTYYLRRNELGYHSDGGALFLDEHISLRTRPSAYLIFGHNMKTGDMFGVLRQYENPSFYRQNALVEFDVLYEDGQYVVFAVSQVDTVQGLARYAPFMQLPSLTGEERLACVRRLQALSAIDSPVQVDERDQLLLMITCEGDDDSRRVVAARRLREGESAQSLSQSLQRAKKRE